MKIINRCVCILFTCIILSAPTFGQRAEDAPTTKGSKQGVQVGLNYLFGVNLTEGSSTDDFSDAGYTMDDGSVGLMISVMDKPKVVGPGFGFGAISTQVTRTVTISEASSDFAGENELKFSNSYYFGLLQLNVRTPLVTVTLGVGGGQMTTQCANDLCTDSFFKSVDLPSTQLFGYALQATLPFGPHYSVTGGILSLTPTTVLQLVQDKKDSNKPVTLHMFPGVISYMAGFRFGF